jgi:hypothetical protein
MAAHQNGAHNISMMRAVSSEKMQRKPLISPTDSRAEVEEGGHKDRTKASRTLAIGVATMSLRV